MFPYYQGSAGISGSKGAIGERGAKVTLSLLVIIAIIPLEVVSRIIKQYSLRLR